MANYRDHLPISIDRFNGLYDRGDKDNTPLDHFQSCGNVRFIGDSSFASRYGVDIFQTVGTKIVDIARIYDYPTTLGNTLIVLTYNVGTNTGKIYHIISSTVVYGPILTIVGMKDFAFLPFAGRGYISPFSSHLPVLNPPQAQKSISSAGAGLGDGTYQYATTFTGAAGIETTPSPVSTALTSAGLANPTNTPTATDIGVIGSGNLLTVGGSYRWKITYVLPSGAETLVGNPTLAFTAPIATHDVGLEVNIAAPAGVTLFNVYRTVNGGTTYYRESSNVGISLLAVTGSGNYFNLGVNFNDAAIIAQPTVPVANTTVQEQVTVSQIPTGGPLVTGRKLYRTVVNGSQLKLVHTFADNTTATYVDTNADGTLGANVPTSNTFVFGSNPVTIGLTDEFLYVYAGDGTNARKAAGASLSGTPVIANGAAGHTDAGLHVFGWVSETISGYLSEPAALGSFTTSATLSVSFTNVPVSTDTSVIKRHLVASAVIPSFNGDLTGYDLFFVPGASINNNSDTSLSNISFYDADLLDDASHLFDNYSSIPAGAVLTLYNNRLCLFATATDISLGLVSAPGEPEAISQVDGLLIVPPNGNPISNAQELRSVLYVNKNTQTTSFTDNGDAPSTWLQQAIDNGLGSFVHGVATVLDSGAVSVDYLIIATYQGISLFNGRYVTPELSWKIENYWRSLDRTLFDHIQIVNDSIRKEFYVLLSDATILIGNYANGLDPKNIRWSIWTLDSNLTTISVSDINDIVFGIKTNGVVNGTSGVYKLSSTLRHDVLYNTIGTTTNTKIPDPFYKTGFIGG